MTQSPPGASCACRWLRPAGRAPRIPVLSFPALRTQAAQRLSHVPPSPPPPPAFNHGPEGDAEAEYDRLRGLAREAAQKRNSCFDRAHQAYEKGDGAGAKALSNEGKEHAAEMERDNKQAAEFTFRADNAPGRVDSDTIDLHGQFAEEAEDILEARIRDAKARGQTHLHVIVGKGHHSAGGVQKIKPRVEQVCRELGLQYETEENAGRIYVNLQGGEARPPPPHHDDGGQQHQQPGEEDIVEKITRRLVKKLGDCCVIM